MLVFVYDQTIEGLLSAVFEAYRSKRFPDRIMGPDEPRPLLAEEVVEVAAEPESANRVWRYLEKRLGRRPLNCLMYAWLSEQPERSGLIFRYIQKVVDSPGLVETDYGDPAVLNLRRLAQKVNQERLRLIQFARFQKTAAEIYLAVLAPRYNVLGLVIPHFRDRLRNQKWIIYDRRRDYGYYYNLASVAEVRLEGLAGREAGRLSHSLLAENEKELQKLWRGYFKALTIEERLNPKRQRQYMPRRFWPFLTEMAPSE